jgi:hypothetical protein
MDSKKIPCFSCKGYRSCSRHTRAFVNYCGSRREMYTEQIHSAVEDCLARRGLLFQRFSTLGLQHTANAV